MGTNHSVYMANDSGQDIYVICALNPDWAMFDFMADIALLTGAVTELKSILTGTELPKTLSTIKDLFEFLRIATLIGLETASIATRPADAALSTLDAFKKTAKQISNQDHKDVHQDNMLNYFNADGIAAVAGAQTVSIMVMSADSKQLALWNSGSDQSWIATSGKTIVRSKYGTIWQKDPDTWTVAWPDTYKAFPWGDGNDDLVVGKPYIINIQGTAKVLVGTDMKMLRVWPYVARLQWQYWFCTDATADEIGFRNANTRCFLGRDVYENMACYASSQASWEGLTMKRLSGGGYRLYAHLDRGTFPAVLKSDDDGEYMQVVADSDTVVGLHAA